jgi:archaellum component FlaG (FlaF/FlaG flagellin family)
MLLISVDKETNELTAQGPGTATITITYGGATYTKTFTVKNDEREFTKIDADKTSLTVVKNGEKTAKVKLLDQYGDPIAIGAGGEVVNLQVSDVDTATASLGDSAGEDGEATLTVTGKDTGSAIITFRDDSNNKIGTTSVKVTVTENGTISKYELKADTDISNKDVEDINALVAGATKQQISTDATIDAKDDKFLKIDLKAFNSAGAELAKPEAADYTVETPNESKSGVINDVYSADGYIVVEAGDKAGTATITVRDDTNRNIVATFKVTV